MTWTLFDSTLTYTPNFSSRISPHTTGNYLWVSNIDPGSDYVISYNMGTKAETQISLAIDSGGPNYKGASPSQSVVVSNGTQIVMFNEHGPDLAGGGRDHTTWTYSSGTTFTEDDDLSPNAGIASQMRAMYLDGLYIIPKSWADVSSNPQILAWTSTDGLTWSAETANQNVTAISGRFPNNPQPVIIRLTTGEYLISAYIGGQQWQYFSRNGSNEWEAESIVMSGFSYEGIDHYDMFGGFGRIYRKRLSGAVLEWSADKGQTWNNAVTEFGEVIQSSQMGGIEVVFAHSSREFLSFNYSDSPSSRTYALFEFNPLTEVFDYVDDMPNDSSSLNGAWVYQNELYIYQSDNIYKHDDLSFGEVVTDDFALLESTGLNRHNMTMDSLGEKIFYALEREDTSYDVVLMEDIATGVITEIFNGGATNTVTNVERFPSEDKIFIFGKTGGFTNAQIYNITDDTTDDVSNGGAGIALQPAQIARNSIIMGATADGDIDKYDGSSWNELVDSALLTLGVNAMNVVFLDGLLPDLIVTAGQDENGINSIIFSANEFDDQSSLEYDNVFGDQDGTPVIVSLDMGLSND